jgi:hypothetical protein
MPLFYGDPLKDPTEDLLQAVHPLGLRQEIGRLTLQGQFTPPQEGQPTAELLGLL